VDPWNFIDELDEENNLVESYLYVDSLKTWLGCLDGTHYGTCSINKPYYCEGIDLINVCQECGCPTGNICMDDGRCHRPWKVLFNLMKLPF